MPERLADLDAIETALWRELSQAAGMRDHPWRCPVLATTADDGAADARVLVLREVHPANRQVVVYSDSRAGKIGQLQARPRATLVFWSPVLSWQLRVQVDVAVATDGLAVATRWATVTLTPAAQDYLSPLPPGAPLDAPASNPSSFAGAPSRDQPPSRGHFSVLTAQVASMDWLELHPQGHRRARFDARGAGRWLTP